jgi:UDP-N-acetylmuramate dehydrogenase
VRHGDRLDNSCLNNREQQILMSFPSKTRHLVREQEPLAPHTWLRIGGPAHFFAEPTTPDELTALVAEASAASIPTRILGGGSNLLVREAGVDALVISLAGAEFAQIRIDGQNVKVGAGAKLGHLVSRCVGAGLAGLEHLVGIPGTVGGALVGNAGVTNEDLGEHVTSVTVIQRDGSCRTLSQANLQFAFRRSNLDDALITSMELKLQPGDANDLTRRMQSSWIIKRAAQPSSELRSAQAFVEPGGISIGELLEASGVSRAAEGEASLSSQFPGYVVVSGGATSDQVLALMSRVRRAVELKTGIALQSQLKIW